MADKKKIILIFDLDGPIGQVNSSLPYNFGFEPIYEEQKNVIQILKILNSYEVSATFAITGFSAESSVDGFELKDLINNILSEGHEIASHSWKHEDFCKLTVKQATLSLRRSKRVLDRSIGFVPPHNRPMTWLRKGRLSKDDNRIFPFIKTGDVSGIIDIVKKEIINGLEFQTTRFFNKFKSKKTITNIYYYNDILVIDGHYCGFDNKIMKHILNSKKKFLYKCASTYV